MSKPYDVEKMTRDEYSFLSRPPDSWNNKLIDANLFRKPLSIYSSSWELPKSAIKDVGILNRLPEEILVMTIDALDIETSLCLRPTNSWFRCYVESRPAFRVVMEIGEIALNALIATRSAGLWTFTQLRDALLSSRCEICGEYGEILQLLKCMRCCFRCLSTDRRLLAVEPSFVRKALTRDVPYKLMKDIPNLRTLGQKSFWGKKTTAGGFLYDYNGLLEFCEKQIEAEHKTIEGQEYLAPAEDAGIGLLPNPMILKQRAEQNRDRSSYHGLPKIDFSLCVSPTDSQNRHFKAALHIPAFVPLSRSRPPKFKNFSQRTVSYTHQNEVGSYCRGCRHYWNYVSPLPSLTHTLYTHSELRSHLKDCVYAKLWWQKLYPPNQPIDEVAVVTILANDSGPSAHLRRNPIHHPRHPLLPYDPDFTENIDPHYVCTIRDAKEIQDFPSFLLSNADFESLPASVLSYYGKHHNPYSDLHGHQHQYPRPATSFVDEQRILSQFQREREQPPAPTAKTGDDHYMDFFVCPEAASQAHWVTAQATSSAMFLFDGYEDLVTQTWKKDREAFVAWIRAARRRRDAERGLMPNNNGSNNSNHVVEDEEEGEEEEEEPGSRTHYLRGWGFDRFCF